MVNGSVGSGSGSGSRSSNNKTGARDSRDRSRHDKRQDRAGEIHQACVVVFVQLGRGIQSSRTQSTPLINQKVK